MDTTVKPNTDSRNTASAPPQPRKSPRPNKNRYNYKSKYKSTTRGNGRSGNSRSDNSQPAPLNQVSSGDMTEGSKPSRIAYRERRNRQQKHFRRLADDGTPLREHRDHDNEPAVLVPERRQFTDSYNELSPEAKELALAIDAYKIHYHRRFVDHEELIAIIRSLGYKQYYS